LCRTNTDFDALAKTLSLPSVSEKSTLDLRECFINPDSEAIIVSQ
jgi:hypothetical protein